MNTNYQGTKMGLVSSEDKPEIERNSQFLPSSNAIFSFNKKT